MSGSENQNKDWVSLVSIGLIALGFLILAIAALSDNKDKSIEEEDKLSQVEEQSKKLTQEQALELSQTQEQLEQSEDKAPEDSPKSNTGATLLETLEPDGFINGHGYVDLGLESGLKWATFNVGSSAPEEAGELYAWGEVHTKSSYTQENSETFKKSQQWLEENHYIDNKGNLVPSHDVATVKWGSPWRMPTEKEISELYMAPKAWGWIKDKSGLFIDNKQSGKRVFLPAVGYDTIYAAYTGGEHGCYWGSTIDFHLPEFSHQLFFCEDNFLSNSNYRYEGLPVRPVCE